MRKTYLLLLLLPLAWSVPTFAQTGPAPAASEAARQHYAVTLLSSLDPIPESLLPRDIAGRVYLTQATVFGRTVYFMRLGFYTTAAEAEAAGNKLAARYPAAVVTEITPDEYLETTGAKPKTAAAAPKAPATAPAPATGAPAPVLPAVPLSTPSLAVTPSAPATQPAAPATVVPAKTAATAAAAAKPVSGLEQNAGTLMEQAREALVRGDNTAAIELLGKILRLPPNAQSQDAQELIGLAHERLREIAVARQEYALYLRLYPEGPGAERVRQRLAALEAPPTAPARLMAPVRKEASYGSIRGSWSQYYYTGQSQLDSTTTVVGLTPTSLTATDQSALINNLDLVARYSGATWDNRFVLRDTYTANFLADSTDTNRLYSAYYEATNKVDEYSGRFGRQPGTSGGVLGRFDGITLGYNVLPKWRVNVVAGVPVEFYSIDSSKQFVGTSVDFGMFANHWNGSLYYILQTVDSIADRQAIGAELRFFSQTGSALLLTDYDTLFGRLNLAMFQANWQSSPATTWNMLLDRRLVPSLSTSNALFGLPALVPGDTSTSITHWMQTYGYTEDNLRQIALDNTPTFETAMLGVSHNLNTTWQIGGDVKRFNLTGIPTSPTVTTTIGTGATMVYTFQTIAKGLFRTRDLSVLSLSLIDGTTYQGDSLALTNRMLFQDNWTVDFMLSYYLQQASPVTTLVGVDTHIIQTDTNRLVPMIRVSYRWRKNISFDTEFSLEKSTDHTNDTNTTTNVVDTTDKNTTRKYLMLGYRWDF